MQEGEREKVNKINFEHIVGALNEIEQVGGRGINLTTMLRTNKKF